MSRRWVLAVAVVLALGVLVAAWQHRGPEARECLLQRTTAASQQELVEVMERCGDVHP